MSPVPTDASDGCFERAARRDPGRGELARCARSRPSAATPRFIARAEGARICDADGHEYIDYVGSWGPLILGHAHPRRRRGDPAGGRARARPTARPTAPRVELAERVVARSCRRSRWCASSSSGTEATMSALRLARGFTGRARRSSSSTAATTATPTACWSRPARASRRSGIPDSPGVPRGHASPTRSSRRSTTSPRSSARSSAHGDDLAAVIVEPVAGNMGCVPPARGLPRAAARADATATARCSIFDEVMTGFRVAPGGAQELLRHHARPHLPGQDRRRRPAGRRPTAGPRRSWSTSRRSGPSTRRARSPATRWPWPRAPPRSSTCVAAGHLRAARGAQRPPAGRALAARRRPRA